jgi:hypothetical protein
MIRILFGIACIAVACAACGDVTKTATPDGSVRLDGALADSPVAATCDPTKPFGAPMPVMGLSTMSMIEGTVRLSPDELTAYFGGTATGTNGELYVTHRATRDEAFATPTLMAAENSPADEADPAVSADGLTLWFSSVRAANEANHIYIATRSSALAEFGEPGLAAGIDGSDPQQQDFQPYITNGGEELWFASTRSPSSGGADIWRSTRSPTGFSTPTRVLELASTADDWLPTLSADRLTVYFASKRAGTGTKGGHDVWMSHRSTIDDGFAAPSVVDELNTAADDLVSWLSSDNCRIYGSTTGDIWMATRLP